ncbi:SPFH domain-containing protein [uncultured Fibrobacter sp.]|uniref:SPFH domain-containing protein n=1 Tax=uncultured Fibrobacter sp. TaxID=261512 RepID=UPI002805C6E8|nr:SPFH domain-containing protein [uncultured Fibrobacter sp.]
MGFFSKNPNEAAYAGGKKHWTDVIKNTGDGNLLIWRQPEEDFNTNSTLVVMPGEEAIFVKQGVIEQVFENGTYKLSTNNYPFLSRLRNAFSGGISTFNCVVYFVRKASSVEIKWGTDSPIQVRDKILGIATKLRARGSYKIQVDNSAKFLETLVGNNIQYESQEGLNKFFISQFQSKIKSTVAKELSASETEVLGIDARLDEFSELIQPKVNELLLVNGLKCTAFAISAIDIDDENGLRQKYDQIGMSQIETIRGAQAQKAALDTLGINWAQQQSAEVLKTLAANSGNIAGQVGAGLGMGAAAANIFGNMANQMFNPNVGPVGASPNVSAPTQPQAAAQPSATTQNDPVEKLAKLKKLLEAGLIEQSEFDTKKSQILAEL